MALNITNLPVDVLSRIVSSIAKLPDGARDVAISMSTCQRFLEASNSIVVHRAVCFRNVQVLGRSHLFQKTNGLLFKCGKAGNPSAEYLLAQVILATSTQMRHLEITKERLKYFRDYSPKYKHGRHNAREDTVVASFMARFTPAPRLDPTHASGSKPNPSPLPMSFHWDFVKEFILKSTPSDFQQMSRHLHDYVYVFVGCRLPRHIYFPFLYLVDLLLDICTPDENTVLVRENDNYFIRYGIGFVSRWRGEVTEVIDWTQAGAVFEEVRVRAVNAFDVIVPALR